MTLAIRSLIFGAICWHYPCQSASSQKCFGFVDGTAIEISRSKSAYQIIISTEHKWVHSLKLQSLALPNGMIANLYDPYKEQHYHSTMLYESNLLNDLRILTWFNNNSLYIYGDPASRVRFHHQGPYQQGQKNEDKKR